MFTGANLPLHRESEPFEPDEGWEHVAPVTDPRDHPLLRRAYIAKVLAHSRKDEVLLRRMKVDESPAPGSGANAA